MAAAVAVVLFGDSLMGVREDAGGAIFAVQLSVLAIFLHDSSVGIGFARIAVGRAIFARVLVWFVAKVELDDR